jgi:hypothetical protein
MFGSTILDAAIAMVFIYLLASLVVSAANELIASARFPFCPFANSLVSLCYPSSRDRRRGATYRVEYAG